LAPAAVFFVVHPKYFFSDSFLQSVRRIFDTATMAQSTQVQREGVAQTADKILVAWRSGEGSGLQRELQQARLLVSRTALTSTFEMETMEALSGAVESLGEGRARQAGAVRLLEHLARFAAPREL
jgi:hypothetical protein